MRCHFKPIAVAAVLIGGSVPMAGADTDWLERSKALMQHAQKGPRPAWLDANPHAANAKALALETLKHAPSPQPFAKPKRDQRRHYVLYASTSLGRTGLLNLFEAAAGRDDVLVVFRGIRDGQRVQEFIREIHGLAQTLDAQRVPSIELDPTRFQNAHIQVVPSLTVEEGDRVLAKVEGVTDIAWLEAQLKSRQAPDDRVVDLGVHGDTQAIAELDLIEVMKTRMAGIDWAAKKREAQAHFWQKAELLSLVTARQDRERLIDITVTAPRDVVTPAGQIIVRQGHRINPLSQLPFTQRLVVFDATQPDQVAAAEREGKAVTGRPVTYLITGLERDQGWQAFNALEQRLGQSVFLLTADVRQRFNLEAVPSVVEQDGMHIKVREIAVAGHD
ncbi:TrbC family F-type conjugative pilus assembly protein [Methylomonas koyamae]|uniref:TrbC family F-type conjugative pilus assembly protein n=1 Tax=Methylomonas koyamae TaxID=702114 RepID=UPI000BC2DB53|nr:TrbC family F-type conjugative pilus assembly protein [Methylomonas koyamae]ATG92588.1 conjugal transfer pilus assembly protein TraW [Methylomonas koyamae]